MSVFVTDADYKHTLAIVRSLCRKGIVVDVGTSSNGLQLSCFSKYCQRSYSYPNKDLNGFVHFFRKIILKYDVIIPVGYLSAYFLSMKKEEIDDGDRIPLADFSSFKVATSKKDSIGMTV